MVADENLFFFNAVQQLARCLAAIKPTPWEKVRVELFFREALSARGADLTHLGRCRLSRIPLISSRDFNCTGNPPVTYDILDASRYVT